MRRILLLIIFIVMFIQPVKATEFTAPEVPDVAEEYFPEDAQTFSEGLWEIIKIAISKFSPNIASSAGVCLSLIAIILLLSVLKSISSTGNSAIKLAGTLAIAVLLISPTNSLIQLASETLIALSDYGKLLFPVLTAALAAQGGVTSSAALYAGTAAFDVILTSIISGVIKPLLYIYLCLCIACSMTDQPLLKNLRNFIKWGMTWCLKTLLYVFTGYLSITRVISGTVDASTLKATKLAISGAVPIVGGLISDASEAVIVGAGLMKNAVGVYGLLAILSILIGPFLQIGCQYLLLKMTSAVCAVMGDKDSTSLISDVSGAMGMLLAMTGTTCLLLMVSTVCFMKGVT